MKASKEKNAKKIKLGEIHDRYMLLLCARTVAHSCLQIDVISDYRFLLVILSVPDDNLLFAV